MHGRVQCALKLRACSGGGRPGRTRSFTARMAAFRNRNSSRIDAEVNSWRMPQFNQSSEQPLPEDPTEPEAAVREPNPPECAPLAEQASRVEVDAPQDDCSCSLVEAAASAGTAAMPKSKKKKRFDQRIQELTSFYMQHGHCRVPLTTGLGGWITYQRRQWKAGKLPLENYHALAALGFEFDHFAARWSARFSQLSQFHSQYGHCTVPADPATEAQWPGLRQWTLIQRQAWKRGLLLDDRVRRLSGLGFVWRPAEVRWEERFAELAAFKQAYGHCNVPKGWPLNQGLATWVENVRTRWRTRHGARPLTHTQEERLRALGFEFEPQRRSWEERYLQLARVKRLVGHLGGPFPSQGRWAGLGEWVVQQRHKGRAGRLHPHRYQALGALGFVWDLEEAAWESQLEALDALMARVGVQVALDMLEGRSPAAPRSQRQQQPQQPQAEEAAEVTTVPAGGQPEAGPWREKVWGTAQSQGSLAAPSLIATVAPAAAAAAFKARQLSRRGVPPFEEGQGLLGPGKGDLSLVLGSQASSDGGECSSSGGGGIPSVGRRRKGMHAAEPADAQLDSDDNLILQASGIRAVGGDVDGVLGAATQQGQLHDVVRLKELLRWFRSVRRQAAAGELRPDRALKLEERGLHFV